MVCTTGVLGGLFITINNCGFKQRCLNENFFNCWKAKSSRYANQQPRVPRHQGSEIIEKLAEALSSVRTE